MFFCTVVITIAALLAFCRALSKLLASDTTTSPGSKISKLESDLKLLRKSSLKERAEPNQRLVKVFGISNAFTTTDENYYRSFVGDARRMLRTSNEDWRILASQITVDVGHEVYPLGNPDNSLPLVELVQVIVFRAVMLKFFPDTTIPSDQTVRTITSNINTLWCASKDESYLLGTSISKDKEVLLAMLRQVFSIPTSIGTENKHNPLNTLLPAYETLWRIVLRLFLQIRFRSTEEEYLQYAHIFNTLLSDPLPQTFDLQFINDHFGHTYSAKNIISEGLRLYPPTRRIYRQTPTGKISVDVEALHQDPAFWGPNSLEFDPARFSGKSVSKLPYFLPFGSGVFECPAKGTFGPMMIGVLVSVLVVKIGKQFGLRGDGAMEVREGSEPFCNGRIAFEGLEIVKSDGGEN